MNRLPDRKHLLLGNGFSIACDKIFHYSNLFEFAKKNGLTQSVVKVFEYLGINNFEGVMRLIEDSKWVVKHYGLKPTKGSKASLSKDLLSIKKSLISALTSTHLPNPSLITDERKGRCVAFLEPYFNIFTTNYDLLLYWVSNHGQERLKEQDCFRASSDYPTAEYLVFSQHLGRNKGILFLHGALHLYVEEGEIRKHSWVRSNKTLIELIRDGLNKNQYPHFVTEGKALKKLEQIQRSDYLSYCLSKLERIQHSLVIYGLSLNQNDHHIVSAISDNPELENVYIGLYTERSHRDNKQVLSAVNIMKKRRLQLMSRNRSAKPLNIEYYDSKTATVWDECN